MRFENYPPKKIVHVLVVSVDTTAKQLHIAHNDGRQNLGAEGDSFLVKKKKEKKGGGGGQLP